MLQKLRDKSQGVVAIVIIGFIALTFALWGVHNYFGGGSASAPIAKVNGVKITNQTFQNAFGRFRQMQMQQNPQLFSTQAAIAKSKHEVLQSLITTQLLTQSAEDNDFSVSQQLVMYELARMPLFQQDGQFSKARFQLFLQNAMFTQQQFFTELSTSMVLSQVRAGFISSSFALPYQIHNMVKFINQKRSFHYVMVPVTQFANSIHLPDSVLQAYYKANQKEFTLPAKVSVQYLELSLNKIMAGINPSEAQLKTYYTNNLNHYTIPKKWSLAHILISVPANASQSALQKANAKASKIYGEVSKGVSFGAYAKKDSDDVATSDKGGQLPEMTLLEKSTAWQRQMTAFTHVGQVSPPFKTQQGYEIIKLRGTTPAIVKPYASVRASILKDYRQTKAEKIYADQSDKLSNTTFEHPNSLAPAAKQLGLTVQTTPAFTNKGEKEGIASNPKFVAAAFSKEVLNQNVNSDAIQLNSTSTAVIRLAKKSPASVKPFAEVKAFIAQKLSHKEAMKQAKALATQILAKAKRSNSLSTAASAKGLQDHPVSNVDRTSEVSGVNPAILQAAFNAPKPTKESLSIISTDVDGLGYAVLQVNDVQEGNPKSVSLNVLNSYNAGTSSSLGTLDYTLYQKGLRDKAKIKIIKS
jgi:peptidyl-prolyl cis-trans isomerase D